MRLCQNLTQKSFQNYVNIISSFYSEIKSTLINVLFFISLCHNYKKLTILKSNYNNLALLLLRLGFGGLMLTHGIPKLEKLSDPSQFGDPIGVGPTASLILCLIGEVLAPALLIIGFKTKLAAIPAAITMAVAAFIVHGGDPLRKKELALLYFIAFIVMYLAGPGKYSVDGYKGR